MFDEEGRYVIQEYQSRSAFSSFLPGIAGPLGVPVWCYYNNRGQAVCSFGARDKDHAIMEFSPACSAYRDVSRRGFRTFCKVDGVYRELFTENPDMHIGSGELEITENSGGLAASALYFGLPGERSAALIRVLTLRNISTAEIKLELLDGMPEVVPYGVSQDSLKNMANLAAAWMRVENVDNGIPLFRVRASMEDTAQVREITGCNFAMGFDGSGALLHPVVDQRLIFGEDSSLSKAKNFIRSGLRDICRERQMTENALPCCFMPKAADLTPGDGIKIFSLIGQADRESAVAALVCRVTGPEWFEAKRQEALRHISELTSAINTKTADPIFDGYCKQTYLDNLLRGGVPYFFESGSEKKPFYLYSRKHGDPEREYNYFSLGGEYFAQGNGNFRDVNQNRRCDTLFAPEIGDHNIRTFYELIQPDGYNPLVLKAVTYTLAPEDLPSVLGEIPPESLDKMAALLSAPFTPGTLAMAAEDCGFSREEVMRFTARAVCASHSEPNADFSEGYWCDHWTYNLDLIENYLAVYPEREQDLLFGSRDYRWYAPQAAVRPRAERYVLTDKGLRQYHALKELPAPAEKWVTTTHGEAARSTLIEKLLLLCAIKAATLDAAGIGIEMEGGKPGWYDALNGLPALMGSSVAETCELLRLVRFTAEALGKRGGNIELYAEIADLIRAVADVYAQDGSACIRWDKLNRIKEAYRARVSGGFDGTRHGLSAVEISAQLKGIEAALDTGIRHAMEYGGGVLPTYFTFDAGELVSTPNGPMPGVLTPHPLPLFLEGPVHWLKLDRPVEEKRVMAANIRNSGLYDRELHMYKVNESLSNVSFEAGRAKAFTPGWLENESIWLHMEYKYLLELLKSGLYNEFAEAFRNAAVPFIDPIRYGRSPLENVSFLASSANPDPERWGRGYVARLSGSTAEFLEMWQLMFFGESPFRVSEDGLGLMFEPFIPDYLIPKDGMVHATFLGRIPIIYLFPDSRENSRRYTVDRWTLDLSDGTKRFIEGPILPDTEARAVREGQTSEIEIILKK